MNQTPYDRVKLARSGGRPTGLDYIQQIFQGFIELHGDRRFADDPAIVLAPFRSGRAVFLSLNPGPDNTFSVFHQSGTMLCTPPDNKQNNVVAGWFRPDAPLPDFLEAYSRAGGIHHAALIYSETDISGILSAILELRKRIARGSEIRSSTCHVSLNRSIISDPDSSHRADCGISGRNRVRSR